MLPQPQNPLASIRAIQTSRLPPGYSSGPMLSGAESEGELFQRSQARDRAVQALQSRAGVQPTIQTVLPDASWQAWGEGMKESGTNKITGLDALPDDPNPGTPGPSVRGRGRWPASITALSPQE